MSFFDGSVKKINILLDNIDRSSVCLTIAVIFAPFVGGVRTENVASFSPFAIRPKRSPARLGFPFAVHRTRSLQ